MAGSYFNCKPNHRCKICGGPDWCSYVTFPNGDMLHYCQRVSTTIGEAVSGIDGKVYISKKETKEGFTVFEEISQYEHNRAEFLKEQGKQGGSRRYVINDADVVSKDIEVEGVSSVLPPKELDMFYRNFLSLLVLEDKHKKKLYAEWGQKPGLYESILSTWPIKSIPPEDFTRYSSKERLKNPSRKKIMQALIEKCGEPKGVPGFYQKRDGSWTFYRLCGIAFPVYNTDGLVIRVRVNDDYPEVTGALDGKEGKFRYAAKGEGTDRMAGWFFVPQKDDRYDYDSEEPVWEFGKKDNKVSLDGKYYPPGKVSGKYKNFSSYREKTSSENGVVKAVNMLTNGCQSGSYCSLYSSSSDDYSIVYVTEGEKKAMVANKLLHVPVVSVPGVNSFKKLLEAEDGKDSSIMQVLQERGMNLVVIAYDADKSENLKVLKSEQGAVVALADAGLKIAIGEWDASWGKGLDDIVLTGVVPKIYMVR